MAKVWVDAGHGGKDPGAVGIYGLEEAPLNLVIAQEVAAILRRAGHEVRTTREGDSEVTLTQRVQGANAWDADLFVSIHCNAAADSAARGLETFAVLGGHAEVCGRLVQVRLCAFTGGVDRHFQAPLARWTVLYKTKMPAILVECGFVTHAGEANFLSGPNYRNRVADAICAGVLEYLGWEKSGLLDELFRLSKGGKWVL